MPIKLLHWKETRWDILLVRLPTQYRLYPTEAGSLHDLCLYCRDLAALHTQLVVPGILTEDDFWKGRASLLSAGSCLLASRAPSTVSTIQTPYDCPARMPSVYYSRTSITGTRDTRNVSIVGTIMPFEMSLPTYKALFNQIVSIIGTFLRRMSFRLSRSDCSCLVA